MPLALDMWGVNLYTGGHYDNYVVRYTSYRAGPIPEAVFQKPDLCAAKTLLAARAEGWRHDLHAQVASLLPNPYYGAPSDQSDGPYLHAQSCRSCQSSCKPPSGSAF